MLVVDDEPGMRQLLQSAFEQRGFDVSVATNGDRAVDELEKGRYDVVITDLKMPGRDGFGVLRAVKGVSADTKVIMITAYGSIEKAVEAMQMGASDFIAKPFKLAEIELKVDKLIKRLNGAAKAAAGGNGSISTGSPKSIDTGIDIDHPDLNVVQNINCTNEPGGPPWSRTAFCDGSGDDDNGHGTHLAGTIGALDNGPDTGGIAVVGVPRELASGR